MKEDQLQEALAKIQEQYDPLFKRHALYFLEISTDRNELATSTRRNNDVVSNAECMRLFKVKFKNSFLHAFKKEIYQALRINVKVLLAFDVFNAQQNFRERTKIKTKF